MDSRYNFQNIVAVKIAVVKDNSIFLIKEPETNSWKPGKWGLPGGKILLGESILEALDRKAKSDIGFNISTRGLIKIINIPLEDRNVYQFIFLADYVSGEIDITKIEVANAKWFTKEEIEKLSKDDFTEYYNDKLLTSIIGRKLNNVSPDLFLTQDLENQNFVEWMQN